MGLAEEAARAAAERKRREAAAPPEHGREAALALARTHAPAVERAFKEAADVLTGERIAAAVAFIEKHGMWGTVTPRFGKRMWPVAGHLLEATGQVTAARDTSIYSSPQNRHPNASWARGFSRWDKGTRFIRLEDPVRVNFGKLGPASDDCSYIRGYGQPIWHVCPAQSRKIILGRPEGPLLGTNSGGSLEDDTLITRDLLESIHHSVMQLVRSGGEYG